MEWDGTLARLQDALNVERRAGQFHPQEEAAAEVLPEARRQARAPGDRALRASLNFMKTAFS